MWPIGPELPRLCEVCGSCECGNRLRVLDCAPLEGPKEPPRCNLVEEALFVEGTLSGIKRGGFGEESCVNLELQIIIDSHVVPSAPTSRQLESLPDFGGGSEEIIFFALDSRNPARKSQRYVPRRRRRRRGCGIRNLEETNPPSHIIIFACHATVVSTASCLHARGVQLSCSLNLSLVFSVALNIPLHALRIHDGHYLPRQFRLLHAVLTPRIYQSGVVGTHRWCAFLADERRGATEAFKVESGNVKEPPSLSRFKTRIRRPLVVRPRPTTPSSPLCHSTSPASPSWVMCVRTRSPGSGDLDSIQRFRPSLARGYACVSTQSLPRKYFSFVRKSLRAVAVHEQPLHWFVTKRRAAVSGLHEFVIIHRPAISHVMIADGKLSRCMSS